MRNVADTEVHIVNVGQGNMVLIKTSDGKNLVFDCNITELNKTRVLAYVSKTFGKQSSIYAFICSHRDADHMRGIKKLHAQHTISRIWDSGYPGTTTNTSEYLDYMALRRSVTNRIIRKKTRDDFGQTRLRYLSARDDRLQANANAQGVVIKVEHRKIGVDGSHGSAILPGDSDAETWRLAIQKDYSSAELSANLLMAAHHGSLSFFDDDSFSTTNYYTAHMRAISPAISIISVGTNVHGHPKAKAVELYKKYSVGTTSGTKVARTDEQGTMKLLLTNSGTSISYKQ